MNSTTGLFVRDRPSINLSAGLFIEVELTKKSAIDFDHYTVKHNAEE